jgi:hypothetical protein
MKPLICLLNAAIIGIVAGYTGMTGGRAILNLVESKHSGVSVARLDFPSESVKFDPTQMYYGYEEVPPIAPTPTSTTIASVPTPITAAPGTIAAAPVRHSRTVGKHKRMARRGPNFLQKLFVGFVELQKTGKIQRGSPLYAFSRSRPQKVSSKQTRTSKFRI